MASISTQASRNEGPIYCEGKRKTGNRANYLYCTCISKYFTDQRAKKRPKKGSHFSHEIF